METPSVTFACCLEYGPLEEEIVRLVTSLRQNGGCFSSCPVIAVSSRHDPPLRKATKSALRALDVHYIRKRNSSRYDWYHFVTKPNTLDIVEQHANTELIVYLDCDTLIADEPQKLILDDHTDIAVSASSSHGGTTGPDDVGDRLWLEMSRAVGLSLDSLPWVTTELDKKRIRFYVGGGMFSYRRATRFSHEYKACLHAILAARLRCHHWGIFLLEQAAFGMAIIRKKLRYKLLPDLYNFHLGPGLEGFYSPDKMRRARILHYHKSMDPSYWPTFIKFLEQDRPELLPLVNRFDPIQYAHFDRIRNSITYRNMFYCFLKLTRKLRRMWYEKALCTEY
jgi:hypothetical protein